MEYLRFIVSSLVSSIINLGGKNKSRNYANILIVRLDHLGDLICSLSAVRTLRLSYPKAKISALVGEWNVEAVKHMSDINAILVYNSSFFSRQRTQSTPWRQRLKLFKILSRGKIDLVVGLRDDMLTIFMSLLIFPKHRVDRGTARLVRKLSVLSQFSRREKKSRGELHEEESNLEVVEGIVKGKPNQSELVHLSIDDKKWLENLLNINKLTPHGYSVFHPGASWKFRRWPIEYFQHIGDFLFRDHALRTVIIGTKEEHDLGERLVASNREAYINLVGMTSLSDIFALFSSTRLVVCNDSGPMHISAMMGAPTIALLGPNDPSRFGPRGNRVIGLHKKLECHPCKQILCVHPEQPCVSLVSVDEVRMHICQLLRDYNMAERSIKAQVNVL